MPLTVDSASHENILECRRGELSRILNSKWSMEPLRRCRSPSTHEHAPRTALKTRVRHFSLRRHRHGVLESVVVEVRRPLLHRRARLGRIGGNRELDRVFSEAQRRHRRAIAPLQIVPRPGRTVRFAEEIAVVPHHAAFDRAHTRLHHLRGEQIQNIHRLRLGFNLLRRGCLRRLAGGRLWRWRGRSRLRLGRLIGIVASAQRRIAGAENDDVPVQNSRRVYFAVRHHMRGPRQRLNRKQSIRGGSRGKFRI